MNYSLGLVSLLGMQVVPQFSGTDFVFLRPATGTPIALRSAATFPAAMAGQSGGFELGLEVEDVDAAYCERSAKGVEILSDVGDMGAGRVFIARDPEDHLLSVYQIYPQVKAMRQQYGV